MVYNTETGDVQPFPKMMLLDASDRDNDVIYAQMTVPRPGDYVFIMDYVNKIDRLQTLSVTVAVGGEWRAESFSCPTY